MELRPLLGADAAALGSASVLAGSSNSPPPRRSAPSGPWPRRTPARPDRPGDKSVVLRTEEDAGAVLAAGHHPLLSGPNGGPGCRDADATQGASTSRIPRPGGRIQRHAKDYDQLQRYHLSVRREHPTAGAALG